MKNLLVVGIVIIGFVSCNKDEFDDLETDLSLVKENLDVLNEQNDILLDSIADLSETINSIDSQDSNVLKNSQLERGAAIGVLFESIARQPEAFDQLDDVATKFIGPFDPSQMSNDFSIDGESRGIALSDLFISVARQPEAFDILESTATKFLGDYDATIFSDDLIEVSKVFAISGLNEALARQPEAGDLLNSLSIKFLNFNFLDN